MADFLKLARAWACYWTMKLIEALSSAFPRSRTKTRVVNFLCAPFFGYGGYWAMRENPNLRAIIIDLEKKRHDH